MQNKDYKTSTHSYNSLGERMQGKEEIQLCDCPFEIERTVSEEEGCFLDDLMNIFIEFEHLEYKE